MNIFRQQILDFCSAVLSVFVGLRFKTIWDLKAYLKKNGVENHRILTRVYAYLTGKMGSFIGIGSEIAQPPVFPHGIYGIFISENAVIGKNCTIFQQVTIGSNTTVGSKNQGSPHLGDNVYIGAGAKIIGGISVGDNCRIGANASVVKDMPPDTVAVCAATRFIHKEGMDNTFVSIGQYNSQKQIEAKQD